jgi:hypothetical protein
MNKDALCMAWILIITWMNRVLFVVLGTIVMVSLNLAFPENQGNLELTM